MICWHVGSDFAPTACNVKNSRQRNQQADEHNGGTDGSVRGDRTQTADGCQENDQGRTDKSPPFNRNACSDIQDETDALHLVGDNSDICQNNDQSSHQPAAFSIFLFQYGGNGVFSQTSNFRGKIIKYYNPDKRGNGQQDSWHQAETVSHGCLSAGDTAAPNPCG